MYFPISQWYSGILLFLTGDKTYWGNLTPILKDIRLTELLTKLFRQLPQSIPTHWFYHPFSLPTPLFPRGAAARVEHALQLLQQLLICAVKSIHCRHLTNEHKHTSKFNVVHTLYSSSNSVVVNSYFSAT